MTKQKRFTTEERRLLRHALDHLTVNRIHEVPTPTRSWYWGNREDFIRRHKKAIEVLRRMVEE